MHCGSPRGNREKGAEQIFEKLIAENSLNLVKDTNVNIQEAQQTPSRMNWMRSAPDRLDSNYWRSKTKNLESSVIKWIITCESSLTKIFGRLLTRIFGGQKALGLHFQALKEKNRESRILYLGKSKSFKNEGHSQINKSWGYLWLLDLALKKMLKRSLGQVEVKEQ